MSKNAELRKQIKQIIDNEKIEIPKRRLNHRSKTNSKVISPENPLKSYDLRALLQEDSKKLIEKVNNNPFTRDISHMQDKKVSPTLSLPILPTDLQVLQKMRGFVNLHTPTHCKREACLENAMLINKPLEPRANIEKMHFGCPTGRQDIKELCSWFHKMLDTHKDSDIDSISLIYNTCAAELIRQVTVNCVERGELLQVLFNYQPEVYKQKQEELLKEIQSIKAAGHKQILELKLKESKKKKKFEEKLKKIQLAGQEFKAEKEKIIEESNAVKRKYNEFVRRNNEEENQWRSKYLQLLMKLRTGFSPRKNQAAAISAASWRISSPDKAEVWEVEKSVDFDAKQFINQEIIEFEAEMLKKHEEELLENISEDIKEGDDLNDKANDKEKLMGIELSEVEVPEGIKLDSAIIEEEAKVAELENLPIQSEENPVIPVELNPLEALGSGFKSFEKLEMSDTQNICYIPISRISSIFNTYDELDLGSEVLLSPDENAAKNIIETPEQDIQARVTSQLINLVAPKTNNQKRNKKKPEKKIFSFKRFSKDIPEPKSIVTKKEQELQQTIDLLNQKLQEKDAKLNEYLSSARNSAISSMDRLKLGLANIQLGISKSMGGSLISKEGSPTNLGQSLGSDVSKEESDFNDEALMPPGCDFYSWKTGYSLGFERGMTVGMQEGELLGIEEKNLENVQSDLSSEEENEDFTPKSPDLLAKEQIGRTLSLRSSMLSKKVKELTKIMQFQFARPSTVIKKMHPVYSLIPKLVSKELTSPRATLSRKIVNKMIHSTYMNCLSKIRNGDSIENLTEQVYDDFYQKYGLKAVSDKRFTEFISSLLTYTSYKRVAVFLRFLNYSLKLDMNFYSRLSFLYYLSALQLMMNLKIGVMVVFDEIADKQMFPTQRALECIKEKLETIVDKTRLNKIYVLVQSSSEIDNKGVNIGGLVELEFVLEIIVDSYETYQKNIEKGIIFICAAFGYEEIIPSYEFLMIVRHISFERIEFCEEETFKKLNYYQFAKEVEGKESYSIQEVRDKCIASNLLNVDDVYRFCPMEAVEQQKAKEEIDGNKERLEKIATDIGENGKRYRTLDGKVFLERILLVLDNVEERESYLSLLAWRIIQNELQRVKEDFLNELLN